MILVCETSLNLRTIRSIFELLDPDDADSIKEAKKYIYKN